MNSNTNRTEAIMLALRSLYGKYGYQQYKMSKFEEYDLYGKHKDFLVSDSVITFTEGGKLMALKPDVTLSIIKNSKADTLQKLCYNENVYRIAKGSHSFKEIMQVGLECFGNIDAYLIGEVLLLAEKSLRECSEDFVLEISHLGILSSFLDKVTDSAEIRRDIVKCVSEKNLHGITSICMSNGIAEEKAQILKELVSLYGKPDDVVKGLKKLDISEIGGYISELESALAVFGKCENIRIDFSAVADTNYYNGIIFKGFIAGIPDSVLSGGQYDKLMQEMGKDAKAIGFAVYLDMLERLDASANEYDVDIMLLYDTAADHTLLNKAVTELISSGKTVFCGNSIGKLHYRQLAEFKDGEVKFIG